MPIVRISPAMPGRVSSAPGRGDAGEQDQQVEGHRHHRVDARGAVVEQHEERHRHQAGHRRGEPGADRVGPQARADGALLEIVERRRQGARPQDQGEVGRLLRRELAAYAPLAAGDRLLDDRDRLHAAVEDDGEVAADVGPGEGREGPRAVPVQGEPDGRPVELVDRRPGVAQVAARDRRRAGHEVEHVRSVADRGVPGHDLERGRRHPAGRLDLEETGPGRRRPRLDQVELEDPGRADDRLRARDVLHPRQLDQDLVARGAVPRDDRLGDPERLDPPRDGQARLADRLIPAGPLDVRPQPIAVDAARGRDPVIARELVVGQPAELGVPVGGHPVDQDLGRRGGPHRPERDAVEPGPLAQPPGVRLRLDLQPLVGVDPQNEVDPAAQVESQPYGLARGPQHPHRHAHHDQHREHPPPKLLLHRCPLSPASAGRAGPAGPRIRAQAGGRLQAWVRGPARRPVETRDRRGVPGPAARMARPRARAGRTGPPDPATGSWRSPVEAARSGD